jgi:hypothetical protein
MIVVLPQSVMGTESVAMIVDKCFIPIMELVGAMTLLNMTIVIRNRSTVILTLVRSLFPDVVPNLLTMLLMETVMGVIVPDHSTRL